MWAVTIFSSKPKDCTSRMCPGLVGWEGSSVLAFLPRTCEALGFIPSATKIYKVSPGASQMAQQTQVTKPDNVGSIPGTHKVESKNQPSPHPSCPLTSTLSHDEHAYIHATYIHAAKIEFKSKA